MRRPDRRHRERALCKCTGSSLMMKLWPSVLTLSQGPQRRSRSQPSLHLQAKLLNQITKFDVVPVHEFRQLLRRARPRLEAAQLERLLELGIGDDLHDVGVELL